MGLKAKIKNPRWPHTCKLSRYNGVSAFSEGEEEVLYEGDCRKYSNNSIRSFFTNTPAGKMLNADYAMSVPINGEGYLIDEKGNRRLVDGKEVHYDFELHAGEMIAFTDRQQTRTDLYITDVYAGNLGMTIYFNYHKN